MNTRDAAALLRNPRVMEYTFASAPPLRVALCDFFEAGRKFHMHVYSGDEERARRKIRAAAQNARKQNSDFLYVYIADAALYDAACVVLTCSRVVDGLAAVDAWLTANGLEARLRSPDNPCDVVLA